MSTGYLAAETVGNPMANMAIFGLFVVVTLVVVIRASNKNATAAEFFTGGRAFSGPQNGIAIAGDYLSAAPASWASPAPSRCTGFDGFLYSIGFLVAWLVALLLVAELLRNTGKFTMADVLAVSASSRRPVRLAAAISTLAVSLFLPAGADGRCRWSGQPADGCPHRQRRAVHHDRGRRRPDDRVRPRRRHEGHHVGADHQGRAAHRRCRSDDRLGAEQVRLQPVQPHGCRGATTARSG
jgi:hypothetical protein